MKRGDIPQRDAIPGDIQTAARNYEQPLTPLKSFNGDANPTPHDPVRPAHPAQRSAAHPDLFASADASAAPLVEPLDHTHAQRLIVEQTRMLLPPALANALADHLLTCDRCFRYAQDLAHHERQSGKHKALSPDV